MSEFGLNIALHLDTRLPLSLDGFVFNTETSLSDTAGKDLSQELRNDIEILAATFKEVHIFAKGASCLSRLKDLQGSLYDSIDYQKSISLFIDIPFEQEKHLRRRSREPRFDLSTLADLPIGEPSLGDLYGLHFLAHVSSQLQSGVLPQSVVPIVVLRDFESSLVQHTQSASLSVSEWKNNLDVRITRYLDIGAIAVLDCPLTHTQVQGAAAQAYRTLKAFTRQDQKFLTQMPTRHMSWVGVDNDKPFGYLREAMVSDLMSGICYPETVDRKFRSSDIEISLDRQKIVSEAVGKWKFSAHEYTDDELVYGAWVMLSHALKIPELEKWSISDDALLVFLLACRAAYNDFVLYHNFRHVVDVLQALFTFLVHIQAIHPYGTVSGAAGKSADRPSNGIHSLISPFDALALLISAVGHDVGHPGVNNAFLVALNAPLAQLYSDRSVLESFHCAAFSQILRRYWPSAFSDAALRRLMTNSVLATDMGLHFKFMGDLGALQTKLQQNGNVVDGWSPKVMDDNRDLLCGLLIKCADISNVAREFDAARRWALILTDEFSNQGSMEEELKMTTCLFGGPPERDNLLKLGESQLGFINIFAHPLFEAVSSVLPDISFSLDEMMENKRIWGGIVQSEKSKPIGTPVILNAPRGPATGLLRHSSISSFNQQQTHLLSSPLAPHTKNQLDCQISVPDRSQSPVQKHTSPRTRYLPPMVPRPPHDGSRSMKGYKSLERLRNPFYSQHSAYTISPPNTAGQGVADRSAGSFADSTRPTSREWSTTDEPSEIGPSIVVDNYLLSSIESTTFPQNPLSLIPKATPRLRDTDAAQKLFQSSDDIGIHHSHDSFFSKKPSKFSLAFWRQWRRDTKSSSGVESRPVVRETKTLSP